MLKPVTTFALAKNLSLTTKEIFQWSLVQATRPKILFLLEPLEGWHESKPLGGCHYEACHKDVK